MPRRYYSRRTRVVRPKKKWATNFAAIGETTNQQVPMAVGQIATIPFANTLVQNTAQSSSPTPVIVKAGNFKVKGDMKIAYRLSGSGIGPTMVSCVVYVVYVPEGMTANASVITNHPEWIMAWSPVDINLDDLEGTRTVQNVNKFSFSSRLKRNLNSGDKIVCLTIFNFEPAPTATGSEIVNITFSPAILCQYWTCSN